MYIEKFLPPKFTNHFLDLDILNKLTNKNWVYTSSGRASIYQILKPLNITAILVPAYICETVLIPLKKLNIQPVFYDLDITDLNASLDSIKLTAEQYNLKTLLVASMYGNPANLIEIEQYCKTNNIFLIDDAAQSFGAKLNDRYIGTYGNAGFFSFSPGKPTAGHMGSFFWTENKIDIRRKKHCIIHYLKWLDFYYNRYITYNNYFGKILSFFSRFCFKFTNTDNDNICKFETKILGGILTATFNNTFAFRNCYHAQFIKQFSSNQYFRVLKTIRGEPNNHKLVLIFYKKEIANLFRHYMIHHSIYVGKGYKLLTKHLENLPNTQLINNKIIELPIENDAKKMNYLFSKVREFNAN